MPAGLQQIKTPKGIIINGVSKEVISITKKFNWYTLIAKVKRL